MREKVSALELAAEQAARHDGAEVWYPRVEPKFLCGNGHTHVICPDCGSSGYYNPLNCWTCRFARPPMRANLAIRAEGRRN